MSAPACFGTDDRTQAYWCASLAIKRTDSARLEAPVTPGASTALLRAANADLPSQRPIRFICSYRIRECLILGRTELW